MKKNILLFLLLTAFCACKSSKNTTQSGNSRKDVLRYDVADVRPKFVPEPTNVAQNTAPELSTEMGAKHSITEKINGLIDTIAQYNGQVRKLSGYRIIIYAGINREEANKAKEKVYKKFSDADVYTSYQQPTFKVKVGDFFTRLEAQKMYNQLRSIFPNVVVVEDEILIHR